MAKKIQIVHGLLLLLLSICLAGCLADGVRSEPTRTAEVEAEKKVAELQPETAPQAEPQAEQQKATKPLYAELYVDPVPEKARIRVMNIQPKFAQGMRLTAGRYHIEVTAPGYQKSLQWIALEAGKMTRLKVELEAQ